MESIKQNVARTLGNFSNISSWNTTMSSKEVNYMLDHYSDLVICNGSVRKIQVDKITENIFKVYTIKN